jgi:hypothetical protein
MAFAVQKLAELRALADAGDQDAPESGPSSRPSRCWRTAEVTTYPGSKSEALRGREPDC